ncbi:beta-ketoacyl-ACP synthase III [Streptomyces poonensis]|uniref:Beta-ketoacyl-[acyl-carrier-protein] synthase III n=1 Tax=Streptomyces poonensis TaxID=68255 RepID=A0A918Q581_9ACTN|nr:beta-ketoacyl-ACP synthase III [Streptomyces poonensis]GGZ33090.1 3-oxoacyl-[acyl-carrier-protein] synthase 3 protein 1 [Streptomyces poonensis]GLJ93198.1 3-oxoacyl-[acyl-carrier-protein] synthase 3 protein 1 [Streptomyces poonensis]
MAGIRGPERRPGARILGVGVYRPTRVVSNDEICARIDSSDEWIRRRSGIVSRRFAGPDETVITMAVEAARKAMAQSGTQPGDVDMVLLATMSFLEQAPAAAPRVAHQLGIRSAGSLDVAAACSGFCYVLGLADSLVRSGDARNVLVIGSEKMSDIVDPEDRGTAFLFGDGAGAVVVGPSETPGIGPVVWGADGERHHMIAHDRTWLDTRDTPGPWPTLRMTGPEVYRWATRSVPEISRQAVAKAGLEIADLAAFVPHQANARIIDTAAESLGLAPHTVVAKDVVTSGNTSAASIPLALDALLSQGTSARGDLALLVGFGAGLAHAAQVVALP